MSDKNRRCCGSVDGCNGEHCQDPQVRDLVAALTAPSWLTHGIAEDKKAQPGSGWVKKV